MLNQLLTKVVKFSVALSERGGETSRNASDAPRNGLWRSFGALYVCLHRSYTQVKKALALVEPVVDA